MLLGRIIMLPYGKKIPDLRFPTSPGNNTVREEEVDFTKPYFGKNKFGWIVTLNLWTNFRSKTTYTNLNEYHEQ
jgi:hypothetical protein